jgi:origin recognition complex subunit 2
VLAELAESGAVRMMATIDHVNAPLLWDKKLLARFNWFVAHLPLCLLIIAIM